MANVALIVVAAVIRHGSLQMDAIVYNSILLVLMLPAIHRKADHHGRAFLRGDVAKSQ